jgi:Na+/H+-translocating membrane pyrophosphatase
MMTITKTVRFPLLLASGFVIQFPLLFLAIAIGTIGRSFDLPIGNTVGLLLSPGIAYFWAEGFHSTYHLAGLLIGVIVNTIYFAIVLFVGAALWKKLRKPVAAAEQIVGPERGERVSQLD